MIQDNTTLTNGACWDAAKQRIESFRPIDPNSIDRAIEILDVLRTAGYECPSVFLRDGGGVTLDWDEWEITVEVDECPGD